MALTDNLLKFEGSVSVGPIVDGEFLGYYKDAAGNPLTIECNLFEISRADGDVQELKSKQRGRYDQTIYSETAAGTSSLKLEFLEAPADIFALMFAGTNQALSQSAGAVTDQEVTVTAKEKWLPLPHRFLNDAVAAVIKNEGKTVTYVVTTDYVIDYRLGLIKIATGSAIVVGDVINCAYTTLAKTGITTRGETNLSGSYGILLDGKNRFTTKDTIVEVYEAQLKSTEAVDLLSSELIKATLEGVMITPTGKNEPYTVTVYSA